MNHVWEHGHSFRASADLWLAEDRGLFLGVHRTEHGQMTLKRRNTQSVNSVELFPRGDISRSRDEDRTLDFMIGRHVITKPSGWTK